MKKKNFNEYSLVQQFRDTGRFQILEGSNIYIRLNYRKISCVLYFKSISILKLKLLKKYLRKVFLQLVYERKSLEFNLKKIIEL